MWRRGAPLDLEVGRVRNLAIAHQPDVAGGAAHVEGDETLIRTGELSEILAGNDAAAGRPGGGISPARPRRRRRGLATIRLHQRPGDMHARLGEGGERLLDVALHDRLHIAIGDDGAASLVLPPDWCDVRERDRYAREALLQELAQAELVGRVDVGEEKTATAAVAFGRVGDALREAVGEILERLVGEWDERLAMEVQPLRYPDTVAPLDQRSRFCPLQREVVFAVLRWMCGISSNPVVVTKMTAPLRRRALVATVVPMLIASSAPRWSPSGRWRS